jgi:hypothetical protein
LGSVEQAPTMADQGDAKILEIIGRQTRQDRLVDLVVAEGRRIALESQILQPCRNVRAVILGSEERQPLIDDDTPLPLELPAVAMGKRRVGLQAVKRRFQGRMNSTSLATAAGIR